MEERFDTATDGKDYAAVNDLAIKLKAKEKKAIQITSQEVIKYGSNKYFLIRPREESEFEHYDAVVDLCAREGDALIQKEALKLEFEYGTDQVEWDDDLSTLNPFNGGSWTYGINMLGRKMQNFKDGNVEGSFDIFIKHSPTFRSFYAWPAWWVMKERGRSVTTRILPKHSLDFKTNNEVFSMSWSKFEDLKDFGIDKNGQWFGDWFVYDNYKRLAKLLYYAMRYKKIGATE